VPTASGAGAGAGAVAVASSDTAIGAGAGGSGESASASVATSSTGTGIGGSGVIVLGNGSHSLAGVTVVQVASASDGLDVPRDLAFHPQRPDQLWVVNRGDESMVVLSKVGAAGQTAAKYAHASGKHFLAQPSALAFGDNGYFATSHEQDQPTKSGEAWDFMGPTLWSSDLAVFNGGESGHVDMLHNSPNAMGIAWDTGNVYWVFDGLHSAITRYDFVKTHASGGGDSSDGIVARYASGEVKRVPGVPSHMELGPDHHGLYIADTGNARIAVLNTKTGTPGADILPNYDGDKQYLVNGAKITTLVDGAAIGMKRPCGLAIAGGILFVGDNTSSVIHAFTLEGQHLDWLDLGLPSGSLMGMTFDASGRLYVADASSHRVLRITPAGP